MTVPNNADPLQDGPIDRRLTWKEPSQLVLTQPTTRPQDQPTWDMCGHRLRDRAAAGGGRDSREPPVYL